MGIGVRPWGGGSRTTDSTPPAVPAWQLPSGWSAKPGPMSDADDLSAEELAEYCRTQAGLLAGRLEEIGAETDALLDEIDEEIAELRSRLAAHTSGEASTDSPPGPGSDDEIAELERLEADLEEKQALAEAERARMAAFRDLSEAYAELAGDLETIEDGATALERVVQFEEDHDAPAYFEDRQTLLESVAESAGSD